MLGLHGVIEFPVLIIAGAFGLQGYQRFVIAFVSRDRGAKLTRVLDWRTA